MPPSLKEFEPVKRDAVKETEPFPDYTEWVGDR